MGSTTQHRLTNRFTRGAAVAVALALPGSFLAMTQTSASAAPVPTNATGSTSAALLGVDVLAATVPGLGSFTAASVDVAPVSGSLTAASPRVSAKAANLGAILLNQTLPPLLTEAAQTAPPTNATATVADGPVIPAARSSRRGSRTRPRTRSSPTAAASLRRRRSAPRPRRR